MFTVIWKKELTAILISLYINNRIIHKKNHDKIKFSIPTHFIILRQISKENNMITFAIGIMVAKQKCRSARRTLKKIIFGIITIDK